MVTPQRTVKKICPDIRHHRLRHRSDGTPNPVGMLSMINLCTLRRQEGWYIANWRFYNQWIVKVSQCLVKYFGPLRALNFGIGGDRTQHVLWRVENGEIPMNLHICVIHCGTNNIDRDTPSDITDGITSIVSVFQTAKPNAKIIITGLLPRDLGTWL